MAFWSQCKILASKVQVCAESKISTVFTSSFCFLSSPELLLLFLPLFFLLLGILVTGKVLGKTLKILGLDERKGRTWVVEKDFHGNFRVRVTRFCLNFISLLDWIVFVLVWFERSLHPAQVSWKNCPWMLKLMTAQVEEVLMDLHPLDSYRQFKGVWVKKSWLLHNHSYSIDSYIILERQNYKIHNHLGNETVSTSAKSCIKTSRSGLADNLPTFNVKQQRKVFHGA